MKIHLLSGLNDPEVVAMLQALYSRSHKSITERINPHEALNPDKIKTLKNSLKKYYIGYNHDSIGNCGWITLFIEQVSLLAAKAIENHPLFNGQESSTRYINYDRKDGFLNPNENNIPGLLCFNRLMQTYRFVVMTLKKELQNQYPKPEGMSDSQYTNAILSSSVDLARGYLPAGTKTQLSWTGHIQAIREHCKELLNHPLDEVKQLALQILTKCNTNYPSAFPDSDLSQQDDSIKQYRQLKHLKERTLGYNLTAIEKQEVRVYFDRFGLSYLELFVNELKQQPKHEKLPSYLELLGPITARFYLDFGSFRDLQRHRKANIPIPEFRINTGMNAYYPMTIASLLTTPEDFDTFCYLNLEVDQCVNKMAAVLDNNSAQYFYPLGWDVPVVCTASLAQWAYMLELRTSKSVHATLRTVMQKIAKEIERVLEINLRYDNTPSQPIWFPRGLQTITKAKECS